MVGACGMKGMKGRMRREGRGGVEGEVELLVQVEGCGRFSPPHCFFVEKKGMKCRSSFSFLFTYSAFDAFSRALRYRPFLLRGSRK